MVKREIIEFIEEYDVKFIRLSFCTPFGEQKNISIMAEEIENALENGVSFDASAIEGFGDVCKSDLLLFPDIDTLSLLPWRPNVNSVLRFYCDIKNPDRTNFEGDSRYILNKAVARLKNMGLTCKIGTECEFYLLKTTEDGEPLLKTLDNGGYLDVAPLDKGENIRRDICLCLEEMGLKPERSHHEKGPGQNEIDFEFSSAIDSADNFLTFKYVVKTIAARNGLFASFMPKLFADKSGNGMHLNISLYKEGVNVFSEKGLLQGTLADNFMAGVMDKIADITLFLNPNNNSYERFGKWEAPEYISWSIQNRSQLVRVPIAGKGNERMELRSPDPCINPYIAFALVLHAGMDGIERALKLDMPVDKNLLIEKDDFTNTLATLPKDLSEAIELAENSSFVKEHISELFLNKVIELKKAEYEQFEEASDKEAYYKHVYFEKL